MSRVGKKPVIIPAGVDVTINGSEITVKGPKGTLSRQINAVVSVELAETEKGKEILINVENQAIKNERAQWGTARSLIQNMVTGVTEGFEKQLEVNGVGYKVSLSGKILKLNVGFSHEVLVEIPDKIDVVVEENVITLKSVDKHLVGEVAANIRKVKKPEPYKGKGIKYMDEVVRRKAGKAQKAAE